MGTKTISWYFDDDRAWQLALLACAVSAEGQQQQPVSSQDHDDEEDESDALTDDNRTLAQSSHLGLKKIFLDRLAEVFAREKEPINLVSCIALLEHQDEISIFVSRNSPVTRVDKTSKKAVFTEEDKTFKEDLETCLGELSKDNIQGETADSLWNLLIKYYHVRIKFHTREFRAFMLNKARPCYSHLLEEKILRGLVVRLEELDLLAKRLVEGEEGVSGLVVEEAYRLARESGIRSSLEAIYRRESGTSLLRLLGFLGRLKAAHQTFLTITTVIPSFQKVNITFIDCPSIAGRIEPELQQKIETVEAFLSHCDKNFPAWLHRPGSRKFKFFRNQSSKELHIHAEIQMAFHVFKYQKRGLLPYFGVSKKTCFLCGHLLSNFGHFATRQNHGKIYPQWTLPSQAPLGEKSVSKMSDAVNALPILLADLLGQASKPKKTMQKESIGDPSTDAGFSNPSNSITGHLHRRAKENRAMANFASSIEGLHLKTDDGKAQYDDEPCSASHETQTGPQAMLSVPRRCRNCSGPAGSVECQSCKSIWYCTDSCRREGLGRHKFQCNGLQQPLTSADYLVLDCIEDRLPTDDSVLKDFGYGNLDNFHDRSCLTGLYQGLVKHFGVQADELRTWQTTGTLREEIKKRYETLSKENGGYYQWFLDHENMFRPDPVEDFPLRDQVTAALAACKDILDRSDRDIAPKDLQPDTKRYTFVFCAMLRKGWHPVPDFPSWMLLGFCTAQYPRDESRIASIYQLVMEKCSFSEFWQAVDSCKVVGLLRKYGLKAHYESLRNFEAYMSQPGDGRASIWDLKKFCQREVPNPVPSVLVDYGFRNCKSNKDRLELRAVYTQFFEQGKDEMELHRACLLNKIYQHVQKTQQLDSRFQRLMQSPYPLEDL